MNVLLFYLLGCHGLPSLKMGLFFFLLGCHGLPSLKMCFFFFVFFFFLVFSRDKLQILRNIACIRLNNDAAAVLLARLEHRHNNLIEGSTRGRET